MSVFVADTAVTAVRIVWRMAADMVPCRSRSLSTSSSASGVAASGCSGARSIAVPSGPFALTAMRPNTIVLMKLARFSAVDVEKRPNSGPRRPPVFGAVPDGEK